MVAFSDELEGKTFWFVGASYAGNEDVSNDFIDKGIWLNGNDGKFKSKLFSLGIG